MRDANRSLSSICVGVLLSSVGMVPFANRYKRKAIARGRDSAHPEEHYLPMIFGGILLPLSVRSLAV